MLKTSEHSRAGQLFGHRYLLVTNPWSLVVPLEVAGTMCWENRMGGDDRLSALLTNLSRFLQVNC